MLTDPLVPLSHVVDAVVDACRPVRPRSTDLASATGCVLAADVVALHDVPPFANSAMDGFAVRAADVASPRASLLVRGLSRAGRGWEGVLAPGEAVKIMTGAPIPAGADAVVMVEDTSLDDSAQVVRIDRAASVGDHVRLAGDDVSTGAVVLREGERLGPMQLGLLASVGVGDVLVRPRLRVGVMSTGDELVAAGDPLPGPASIHDANRPMLLALLSDAGAEAVDLGIVGDDPGALASSLAAAAAGGCDLLVTSGGVSVGELDHLAGVLSALGRCQVFRIAIRPAKPFVLGQIGEVPVLALAGNPVSAMVAFELLVRPALRARAGSPVTSDPLRGVVEHPFSAHHDGKTHYVRASLRDGEGGTLLASPVTGQGSHHLAAAAAADALAVVPDGEGLAAGDLVDLIPIGLNRR